MKRQLERYIDTKSLADLTTLFKEAAEETRGHCADIAAIEPRVWLVCPTQVWVIGQ